ncbi:MAG: hypothetical protein U9O59_06935 [Actinomycetota bacterium]|nr:hypothetical protein [Actinomycetota bacterium]
MRIFLIIFSFLNSVFYILIYSYFDKILEILGVTGLSQIALNYIKLAALLVVGFCVGASTMLVLRLKLKRSLFSFKNLVIVGIFPFICLVLSEGSINGFIINRFFNSSTELSELAYYLFSRQAIWSLWLGFAIGSSIRFSFGGRKYKHVSAGKEGKLNSGPANLPDTENKGHNHPREY